MSVFSSSESSTDISFVLDEEDLNTDLSERQCILCGNGVNRCSCFFEEESRPPTNLTPLVNFSPPSFSSTPSNNHAYPTLDSHPTFSSQALIECNNSDWNSAEVDAALVEQLNILEKEDSEPCCSHKKKRLQIAAEKHERIKTYGYTKHQEPLDDVTIDFPLAREPNVLVQPLVSVFALHTISDEYIGGSRLRQPAKIPTNLLGVSALDFLNPMISRVTSLDASIWSNNYTNYIQIKPGYINPISDKRITLSVFTKSSSSVLIPSGTHIANLEVSPCL